MKTEEGEKLLQVHLSIQGIVQGIGFRYFAQREANKLGLQGWVRNLSNGDVELKAEGTDKVLQDFISRLKNGHPWARVERINIEWLSYQGKFSGFQIT